MIINLQLQKEKGKVINATQVVGKDGNTYKPSVEIKDVTRLVLLDFQDAHENRNRPYAEFNDMSFLQRMNVDKRSFNAYQEPVSNDPDEQWKSRAVRPIVRNRIISIAAHITGSLIFPQIDAQNDRDDEDRDAATVMRDLMEYVAHQADYEKRFMQTVISALVNPISLMHVEYRKSYRKVKEIKTDGTWTEKEVIDEDESGIQLEVVPPEEIYFGNLYENNIQRQPYIIRRRLISYESAYGKYNKNENFINYVKPGVQVLYSQDDELFYEMKDDDLQGRLVEEVIYYNKTADLQIAFVNGVLVTHPDQPNPRLDKRYPFGATGYELIDEGRFIYYKSAAFKTAPDEDVVNTLYRMTIDGTFMQLMPPIAIFGAGSIDRAVTIPGRVTGGLSQDSKITPINTGNNISVGERMLDRVETSISESTSAPIQSGIAVKGEQTAFEISRLEENARVVLGLFGKMIGFLVKDIGELVVSDIVQHVTVGEVMELTPSSAALKFKNFIIPDKVSNSKKKTRVIRMDTSVPEEMEDTEMMDESLKVMEEEEESGNNKEIYRVNPSLFRKMKFKVKVTPDIVTPPSENVKRALNLEEYDRAINNPHADQEALYRDLLLGSYSKTKDDPDKYIKKQEMMPQENMEQPMGKPSKINSDLIRKEIA